MSIKFDNAPKRILVVGDIMLDCYLFTTCERISPEAPVPVAWVNNEKNLLGGAGNVVKNLYSFGANIDVLGVIGKDEAGSKIRNIIEKIGVDTSNLIVDQSRKTTKKTRVIASNQQIIRIDRETTEVITAEVYSQLLAKFKILIKTVDLVLFSDYLKGVLTKEILSEFISIAKKHNKVMIVDPKGVDFSKYYGVSIIKPNKSEAELASGVKINSNEDTKHAMEIIKNHTNAKQIIITLSEKGLAILDDKFTIIPTQASEVYDVSGAGDTVLASLGLCLANGNSIIDSCIFANHAAAIVISKIGTASTTIEEVINHINNGTHE
jgi:D-beta-D-heptose 7-phosphate kinase / D-beta-D-heptose 1-phosphate adenosyltransferase